MIPWEVLEFISTFCCLASRYTLSITCQTFSNIDWKSFHTTYSLEECSKSILKRLIQQDYNTEWSVSNRLNTIWSEHLNKPLTIWSPWTSICHGQKNTAFYLFFREYRFLEFIRQLGLQFKVKTSCVQKYKNNKSVKITIWPSKRIPTYIFKNKIRKKRSSYKYFLNKEKKFRKTRVQMHFGLVKNHLKLVVNEIEFLIS